MNEKITTEIMAIDMGNGDIKAKSRTHTLLTPSTLLEESTVLDDTVINVEYNNKHYTLGKVTGNRRRDYAKYDSEHHKIMLLSTIASLSDNKDIVTSIVVGTPIKYYTQHSAVYRNNLLGYTKDKADTIIVNGIEKTIKIQECVVIPQGATPFGREEDLDETTLVIDIGSGTTDVSYWDGRTLIKSETYNTGCTDFYADLASSINKLNNTYNIEPVFIEKKLVKDKDLKRLKLMGEVVDIETQVEDCKKAFSNNIISKIITDFNSYTLVDNIEIVGGGSNFTSEYMKKQYPHATFNYDAQFNAEIYYKIGENLYDER